MNRFDAKAVAAQPSKPHPALQRLLLTSGGRSQTSPSQRRRLRVFDMLCRGFTSVGVSCSIRHELPGSALLYAHVGSVMNCYEFVSNEREQTAQLLLQPLMAKGDGFTWIESASVAFEQQIERIVRESLRLAELRLRAWAEDIHASEVRGIESARKQAEEEAAEIQRRQEDLIKAHSQEQLAQLIGEAERWHRATLIRAYVEHIQSIGGNDSAWKDWALRMADETDPTRHRLRDRV